MIKQAQLTELAEMDFVRALCSCLVCNRMELIAEIAAWFKLRWLQDQKAYHLVRCMFRVSKENAPATTYSIAKALMQARKASGMDLQEIDELVSNRYTFHYLRYYALEVYEQYRRREVAKEARVSLDSLVEGDEIDPLLDKLGTMQQRFGPAPERRTLDNNNEFHKIIKEIEHGQERAMTFGIPSLDDMVILSPTDLVIVGGRTSAGKSVFLGHVAISAALRFQRVLFFSLEMSADQMYKRWAAWVSEHPIPKPESRHARDFIGGLSQVHQVVKDTRIQMFAGSRTIMQIENEVKAYCRHGDVDLVCVDYLQKILVPRRDAKRHEIVAEGTERLKNLAMDYGVVIMAAAQVNRDGSDKPRLSNLRESGAIEQEANAVILLYPNEDKDFGECTLIAAKSRNGATGHVPVMWHRPRFRYYEKDARDDAF